MELIVKLKQHTPIIHFQWEQAGATLRATELKPKLDRYIRKLYYGRNESVRLKYQVRIKYLSPLTTKGTDKKLSNSMFFGNLNQPEQKKKWEIQGDELELRFNTYFNAELKKQIEETLPICLACENFGTRNNKGSGCFYISNKSVTDFEKVLKDNHKNDIYFFDINNNDYFFAIKTVYMLMKSGINLDVGGSKIYYKPAIFHYFKDKNITWDKQAIKQHFLPNARTDSWKSNANKAEYARILLGGSNVQEWRHYKRKLFIKNDVFERIPSPIVFKVFKKNQNDVRIYLFARDTYEDVKGKHFKFTMVGDKYCEAEFDNIEHIELLCSKIESRLNSLTLRSPRNTIDWLNKLLERSDLHNKLQNKITSNIDKDLYNQAEKLFKKRYRDMNEDEQAIIIKYNRLLIEENFSSSPKINNIPLTLKSPDWFDMNDFLKCFAEYINGLTVSDSTSGAGIINRTKTILTEIVESTIKKLE